MDGKREEEGGEGRGEERKREREREGRDRGKKSYILQLRLHSVLHLVYNNLVIEHKQIGHSLRSLTEL